MDKFVDIDKATIRLIAPGVLENSFKGGKTIDDTDMWELKKANMSIVGNEPYTVLVQAEELISFTVKARETVASEEFRGNNVAKALLFRSLGQRIIANFYMKINKPVIKTGIFGDRQKAIEWLQAEYTAFMKQREKKTNKVI